MKRKKTTIELQTNVLYGFGLKIDSITPGPLSPIWQLSQTSNIQAQRQATYEQGWPMWKFNCPRATDIVLCWRWFGEPYFSSISNQHRHSWYLIWFKIKTKTIVLTREQLFS